MPTCEYYFDGYNLHGPSGLPNPDYYLLTPGFTDLQVNGYNRVLVQTATAADLRLLDKELASLGTTAWLATLITAPLSELDRQLAVIHEVIQTGETGIIGIHIEGPFLGRAPGAHDVNHIPTGIDLAWLSRLPASVKMITLAPEQSNAVEAILLLKARDIVVSLGHTRATEAEFNAAVDAGAECVTHMYNAMSGISHREPGVALLGLIEDRLAVGLIADLIHVNAPALRLAFRAKPVCGVYFVSDAMAWSGVDGLVLENGAVYQKGILTGSACTMADCVRNAVDQGIPLETALRAGVTLPARIGGVAPRGWLAFDADLKLKAII